MDQNVPVPPPPAEKSALTKTNIALIVSGVASGLLMAMQTITLHQTSTTQETTERVGIKTSAELQALQELQRSSQEELKSWVEIRQGLQKGIDRQAQRQSELLADAASRQRELLAVIDALPKTSTSSEEIKAWTDLRTTIRESMERQMTIIQSAAENQKQILSVLGIPKTTPTPTPTPNQP